MDDIEDTAMRPRLSAPGALSFEDTIIRARFPSAPTPEVESTAPPLEIYGFRMSGSDVVIVLDRPAFVGRNPAPPRIGGGNPPRMVKVASPRGEVSSSHVEVRQLGATVIVTDLKSTNGSIVITPGQDARALRQGESMVVAPGTLVDIGDGNVIEILPLHQVD
jgi:hypothetical protein